MISFEYRTPKNLKEVHASLKEFGTDAKLIAGGTALIIMMKQRLVQPSCLVSLRSVRGLNGIEVKDGGLRIGGLATHRAVETSSLVRRRLPLLAETYHHVATVRIRNTATVGGGLAHADPNQDPPPTLIALGATFSCPRGGMRRQPRRSAEYARPSQRSRRMCEQSNGEQVRRLAGKLRLPPQRRRPPQGKDRREVGCRASHECRPGPS